jgi:hypothetical protein
MAVEALAMPIADMAEDGEAIPEPSTIDAIDDPLEKSERSVCRGVSQHPHRAPARRAGVRPRDGTDTPAHPHPTHGRLTSEAPSRLRSRTTPARGPRMTGNVPSGLHPCVPNRNGETVRERSSKLQPLRGSPMRRDAPPKYTKGRSSRLPASALEGRKQILDIDWLGNVGVHSRRQTPFPVPLHGVRRHRHDGKVRG